MQSNLCRDDIWNSSVTWNTTNPNLSECLQSLLQVGISSLFLLCFPIWVLLIYCRRRNSELIPHPRGGWFGPLLVTARIVLYLLVMISSAVILYLYSEPCLADICVGSLVIISCLAAGSAELVMLHNQMHTSVLLPVFWFSFTFFSLPQLKRSIEDMILDEDLFWMGFTNILRWFFLFITFSLHCFGNMSILPADLPPESACSSASTLFFSWYTKLVWKGWKRPLVEVDIPENDISVDVVKNSIKFQEALNSYKAQHGNISLWSVLRCFSLPYFFGLLVFLIRLGFVFVTPLLLKKIVQFVQTEDEPVWRGYLYAVLLFLSNGVAVILDHHGLRLVCISANQMKTAITSAIYRKTLRLSSVARQKFTTGEITNFMSVDAVRFIETVPFSYFCFISPLEILTCLCLIYLNLGVATFSGVAVLLLFVPLNLWTSKKAEHCLDDQLKAKDRRIKLMSEVLSGIKVLKLYAWEKPFMESILAIRKSEIDVLRFIAKLWAFVNFTFSSVPFLMMFATFFTYAYSSSDNVLTPDLIFVTVALFNLIRTPLTLFPLALMDLLKLFVSANRINEFLNADELQHLQVSNEDNGQGEGDLGIPKLSEAALEILGGVFTWEDMENPTLADIDFTVKQGELVAVVGLVGSGKSSLLSAILGEMAQLNGSKCRVPGGIAYVAQQAWIQNLSIKGNILFGKQMDERCYTQVKSACCLDRDLVEMAAGDETEIGENGINISGGQKMRIALARAVYQNAEIYLLDDPLAALDAHVGKEVFDRVISRTGILRRATRVLVTHNVAVLKHVDRIVVMRNGRTAECGSFQELLHSHGPFSEFLKDHLTDHTEDEDTLSEISSVIGEVSLLSRSVEASDSMTQRSRTRRRSSHRSVSESYGGVDLPRRRLSRQFSHEHDSQDILAVAGLENGRDHSGKQVDGGGVPVEARLTEDEAALTGNVKMAVYLKYILSVGVIVFVTNMALYFICEAITLGSGYTLSLWSDNPDSSAPATRDFYMAVYGGLGGCYTGIFFAKELMLFLACATASRKIHENLLERIMHSPMSFFDTNPMGRILNRFSTDIDTVDQMIPFQIDDVMNCFVEVVGIIVIISYSTPWFLAVMVPISGIYLLLQKFYISTSRQIQRMDKISKSPIFSHFSESISGAATIRAFGANARFVSESEGLVGRNNQFNWSWLNSNRWLGLRLENLGNLIILGSSVLCVSARGSLSPGLAGLSISYALMSIESLNWMVRMICALETNAICLERIFEYMGREQESDWEKPSDAGLLADDWPCCADLTMADVTVSYRVGLPPVIRGLSVEIRHGEKVGICGRTGAGKSSLSLLLFRLMELEDGRGGRISIGGEDVGRLGLQLLRSRITIIPQEPVLFSSSLRFNLDPGEAYSDEKIRECLKLSGLSDLADNLQQEVQEKGENFSVGQRQLICLARALLRSSKLLLLDEATAAVDLETDQLVQKTIREQFRDCTVLTIAHRLNTIMDNDRIMVLDRGELKEFDSPEKLLENSSSIFYSLAKESGLV